MNQSKIWKTLRIEPTKDKNLIKEAYRKQLLHTNPEEDQKGFIELRHAYEEAMKISDELDDGIGKEQVEKTDIDLWLEEVDGVYQDIYTRRNELEWERLLENDLCNGLDTWLDVREQLLVYVMKHHFLPNTIWKLLDEKFDLVRDQETLAQIFPKDFINYVCNQVKNEDFINYDLFVANGNDVVDDYIEFFYSIKGPLDEGSIEGVEEKLQQRDQWTIYHPFIDAEKLRYHQINQDQNKMKEYINKLSSHQKDSYIAYCMAGAYWDLDEYEQAAELWKDLCLDYPTHYSAKKGLLGYYIQKKEYKNAKEEAVFLLDHYGGNDEVYKLLMESNEVLIEEHKAIYQIEPDNMDNKSELAWCYYQNSRYDECLEVLAGFLDEYKEKALYLKLHGYIYLRQDNAKEAIEYFLAWLEIIEENKEDEDYPKDYLRCNDMLGASYMEEEDYEKAILYLKEAMAYEKNEADWLRYKARIAFAHLKLANNEECIDECSEIITISHDYYPAFVYRQEAYFNLQNGQEVINDYHNAIEIVPQIVKPYILAAKVFYIHDQYDNSMEVINKAREAGAVSNELDYLYGRNLCFMANDDKGKEKAIEAMEALIFKMKDYKSDVDDEIFTDRAEVIHKIAQTYGNVDWFSEGLEAVNQAIECDPSQHEFYLTKAYLYMDLGNYNEGAKMLEEQVSLYPEAGAINYNLAECYNKMEEPLKALEFYQKTLEINPKHLDALDEAMNICRDIYSDLEKKAYYKLGDTHAQRLLELADSCYYFISAGLFYSRSFECHKALECYATAKTHDDQDVYAYNNTGVVLKNLGRVEEAIKEFEMAIRVMEPNQTYLPYKNLSDCYELWGDYEKAMDYCLEVLNRGGKTLWVGERITLLLRKAGKYEQALSHIKELVQEYDDYEKDSYFQILMTYESQGDITQAKKYAKKLCKANYKLYQCGGFYYRIGELKKAISITKRALKQKDISSDRKVKLYIRLARIHFDMGKYREAESWANQALQTIVKEFRSLEDYVTFKPLRPARLKNLGMVYLVLGNFEKAKQYFEHAGKHIRCKDCKYIVCHQAFFALGRLYEETNEIDLSCENYQKALEYSNGTNSLAKRHYERVKKRRGI